MYKSKNIKSIVILIVIFTMMMSKFVFADNTDITSDKILRIGIDVDNENLSSQKIESTSERLLRSKSLVPYLFVSYRFIVF